MSNQTAVIHTIDTISSNEAATLPGLLKCRIEKTPTLPAYHQYDQEAGKWVTWNWQELGAYVSRWREALASESLAAGERVAILLDNSVEWVAFEHAALSLGLVVVPLYSWDSPENIVYLLQDSGSRLLLVGKAEQWHKIAPHASSLAQLDKILCLEKISAAESGDIACESVDHWLPSQGNDFEVAKIDPAALATIVYTSGTTGPPKGVMLSHRNILLNAEAILKVIPCYATDILLSFLPLSHTFERTVGYYTPMMAGCSVAYCRSMDKLAEDLRSIQPTILVSVPRIYEKIYTKINTKLQQKGGFAKRLFQAALDIGWRRFEADQAGEQTSFFERAVLQPLLHRVVAQKILNRLGGRIRFSVSGGAPLLEDVSRFFLSLGLPLIQGYGLTEAAPVVSTNPPEQNNPASVGPPLPDVLCRIGSDSELLVKSPGLMMGYWNLEEKTAEMIDREGWLHTGDMAEIKDGVIYIRGRSKEIIVTSTGEKVAPADLEMTIAGDPLFDNVMVVGEGKSFLGALVVLHRSLWEELAREYDQTADDPAALESVIIKEAVLARLDGLLHAFPGHARIRTVGLLLDQWTIANGLLTPTLKLKREVIGSRYREEIDNLYRGHEVGS